MIYAIAAILSATISQLLGDAFGLKHGSPERIALIVITAGVVMASALVIDLARERRRRRQRERETNTAREALRAQAINDDRSDTPS